MKSKKRIAWLHSHFLYSTGGTRFIFEVISQLKQQYDIDVYVEQSSEYWVKQYAALDCKVIQISPVSSNVMLYWLLFPFFLLNDFVYLRRQLQKYDVLISSMFPMNFLASMLHKKTINYCFEPFAFFYDKQLIQSFTKMKQICLHVLVILYSWLDKLGTKKSAKLMAINPSVGKWISDIYSRLPDAYSFLGVDTHFFHPTVKPWKEKKTTQIVIFHSTDFTPLKGTRFLLSAFALASKRIPEAKLLISESVENVTEKESLKTFIRSKNLDKQVEFINHVPYKELPSIYTYADIYCFCGDPKSSGATAASLSVLEASSSGLVILRSIGNEDEIIEGKTGFYVNPLDEVAFSEMLVKVVKLSKQDRKAMGENGRKHILKSYVWGKVADSFRSEIVKLLRT